MESTNTRAPWNIGKLAGQKPPLKPKDIWTIRIALQNAHQVRDLPGNVQPRDRQQAARLRSRQSPGPRRHSWKPGLGPGGGRSEKNAAAGAVRANRTNKSRSHVVDRKGEIEAGAMPVPQPPHKVATCLNAAVRPDRPSVGRSHRSRSDGLWYPYDATNQGDPDLQTHEEPQGGPALSWPQKTGLSPAPNYVPCLPDGLMCTGHTAISLDIAISPSGQFRPQGEDRGAFLRGCRCASSCDRGPPTSPTSRWRRDSSTWWRSWTCTAARCSPGG
jgi:hypothetical protein